MSNKMLAAVFLFTSVILIAQTSITVYNYNQTKQAKDLNFYWTCLVLTFSIIGLLASGYMLFTSTRGGANAPTANGGEAAVTSGNEGGLQGSIAQVAHQARATANNAAARAVAAENASKALGILKNTGVKV